MKSNQMSVSRTQKHLQRHMSKPNPSNNNKIVDNYVDNSANHKQGSEQNLGRKGKDPTN